MTRLVFLGLAGIVGLGVAAAAVVLLMTRQPERAPEVAEPDPASARDAVAPPERSIPPSPVQGPQGPPSLQLPPDAVARDLTAALPLCHRLNAKGLGNPAVLNLELEARDGGGFVVVDARVASRGGASEGLVSCASRLLLGRRVAVGSFPPGERFVVRYEVMPPSQAADPPSQAADPPSQAADPSTAPPSTPLSVTRQQLRRRGGSR